MAIERVVMAVLVVAAFGLSSSGTVRCEIQIGSTINPGSLSIDAAAVAKISNSPNQEAWWQLADKLWHDSAIDRFFSIGPLNATEMDKLAAENNKAADHDHDKKKDAWKQSGINIGKTRANDLTVKLQNAATTVYKVSKSITGTGDITASMWTLMFCCMPSSCIDGYMAPVVVVPNPENSSLFLYASVWLPVTDMVLANAIPESISTPVNMKKVAVLDPGQWPGLSAVVNIHSDLSLCASQTRALSYRTLLDSAYGLAPALSCVGFEEDPSFKIGMVRGNQSNNISMENQLSYPFKVSKVVQLRVKECAKAPLMMVDVPGWQSIFRRVCDQSRCITFSFDENRAGNSALTGVHTGIEALKSMLTVLESPSPECTPTSSVINSTTCSAFVLDFFDYIDLQNFSSVAALYFGGASKWVSQQGADTIYFKYSVIPERVQPCYSRLLKPSLYTANSSDLTPPEEMKIQAMAYLTSYIIEHHAAFTTIKGAATDPYTFYALIVSTALSVIAIAVPFTNFMLRAICSVWHSYLNPRSCKATKIIVQICSNVVLTLAFLLPVISLARVELDREDPFHTWALASNDLMYDGISSTPSPPIRVLYLFSATSKYTSHFLTIILLVVCITCFVVAISTARRCLQVFSRYELLYERSTTSNASPFKAIEMGKAEYVDLKLQPAASSTHSQQRGNVLQVQKTENGGGDLQEASVVVHRVQQKQAAENGGKFSEWL